MRKLTFKLEDKFYEIGPIENVEEQIIGNFLIYDVGNHPESFIKWVSDANDLYTSSNMTCLEKSNDKIILTDLFSDKETSEFIISTNNFLKLLQEWQKIIREKPKQVKINFSNSNIEIIKN